MADDEGFLSEPLDERSEGEARGGGFLPNLVIRVLKWTAIGVVIVIVSAATAFFAYRLISRGTVTRDLGAVSPDYEGRPEALATFTEVEQIRGQTADETQRIFSLRINIGYEENNLKVQTELVKRRWEIQDLVLRFISQKSATELSPGNYSALQEELKQQINRVMTSGRIQRVFFREIVVTS